MRLQKVFGAVTKREKFTDFYLEVTLPNGAAAFRRRKELNAVLDEFPDIYGYVLDDMTARLMEQLSVHV